LGLCPPRDHLADWPAEKPASLRFALEPVGDVCRIAWIGASHYVAGDLVQAPASEMENHRTWRIRPKRHGHCLDGTKACR
jgi:hypothetical protein